MNRNRLYIIGGVVLLIVVVLLFLFFPTCKGTKAPEKEDPLARVYDNYLYASDLEGIGKGLSDEDSAYQAKIYIDKWILDQLVLGVAKNNVGQKDIQRIDRLVEEYRASLIIANYEQKLIDNELDTVVTPMQLAEYYTKNKEDYISGFDYVQCFFIKVDRNVENISDLRRWFKSDEETDIEKVKQFCLANAGKAIFALERDQWLKLDNIIRQLPDKTISTRYLEPGNELDRSDDNFIYLFKTFGFTSKDDPAPLSQVQDEISRIILHQRRKSILDNLRNGAWKKATEEAVYEKF